MQWQYDAEGNLLVGRDAHNTYNTAGHTTNVDYVGSTTLTFDSNGQQTKSVEVVFDEAGDQTTTRYYLRSSVLKGRVLTELTESGAKKRGFVYAEAQVLAWQNADTHCVVWEHRDASNASFRTSDVLGNIGGVGEEERSAEMDPSGSNAGVVNPFEIINPPPQDGGASLLSYPNNGNPTQWGTSYSRDGIPMSRSDAMDLFNGLPSGGFSLLEMSLAATTYQQPRYVHPRPPVLPDIPNPFDPPDLIRGYTYAPGPGHWENSAIALTPSLISLVSLGPQDTIPRKTEAQQRCDDWLAQQFGGPGARAGANGFTPNGDYRGDTIGDNGQVYRGHLSNWHSHASHPAAKPT